MTADTDDIKEQRTANRVRCKATRHKHKQTVK